MAWTPEWVVFSAASGLLGLTRAVVFFWIRPRWLRPACVRCRHMLRDGPEPVKSCPACGVELGDRRALVFAGRRRARLWRVALAICLLCVGLLPAAVQVWRDWVDHEANRARLLSAFERGVLLADSGEFLSPAELLGAVASGGRVRPDDPSLWAGLVRQMEAGKLTAREVEPAFERMVAWLREDDQRTLRYMHGLPAGFEEFVAGAMSRGLIRQELVVDALLAAVELTPDVRGISEWREGEPQEIAVDLPSFREVRPLGGLTVVASLESVRVGGEAVAVEWRLRAHGRYQGELVESLPAGKHEVEFVVGYVVVEAERVPRLIGLDGVSVDAWKEPVRRWTVVVRREPRVLGAGEGR